MNLVSVNDFVITEPYTGEKKLEANVKSGFAYVSQKNSLVGLKVLFDAKLKDGSTIKQGQKIFIKEEILYKQKWATDTFTIKDSKISNFVVVELKDVVAIE
jgi:hypothetical protein